MILIGQYDSPFVRRVAIALRLYGLAYEHRAWSVFADAEQVAEYSPLLRVPILVLDNGERLIESTIILEYLDETVGADKAMIARSGPARREALRICALATGLGDKAVSLLYERVLHPEPARIWMERCQTQIAGVLDALEADRAPRKTDFWFGNTIGHADIAVACVLRMAHEAHPRIFSAPRWPALDAHCERCEELEPFLDIAQSLNPPR
jgi:glutathione S-transferase